MAGQKKRSAETSTRKATARGSTAPGRTRKLDVVWPPQHLELAWGDVLRVSLHSDTAESVNLRFESAEGDAWSALPRDAAREVLERLFTQESRLARAATRYGLTIDALIDSLEQSVLDVSDESAGVPRAELDALRAAGIKLEGSETDPTGAAQVALGRARFGKLREDALPVSAAAELMGVTPGRIRQLVSAGDLIAIAGAEGQVIPRWQFHERRQVPGLAALGEIAGSVHPLTLEAFMFRPDPDLEIDGKAATPLEWLLTGGRAEPVADLAGGLALPA